MASRLGMIVSCAVALSIAFEKHAAAGLMLVSSRAGLGGTDFIDWSGFTSVSGATTVTSAGGQDVALATTSGNIPSKTSDGLNGYSSIRVNGVKFFGEANSVTAGFRFEFDNPISAIGADLLMAGQTTVRGNIRVRLSVFQEGASSNSVMDLAFSPNASPNSLDFGQFVGIRSDAADIKSITIAIVSRNDYASVNQPRAVAEINRVDFTASGSSAAVPEPSTIAIWSGLGFVCASGVRRRRATKREK